MLEPSIYYSMNRWKHFCPTVREQMKTTTRQEFVDLKVQRNLYFNRIVLKSFHSHCEMFEIAADGVRGSR